MDTPETRAFEALFGMDIARLYTAGLIDQETLFDAGEDKILMRMVETCGASASMGRTTLQLAANLYHKWSAIVAEVALVDSMRPGGPSVQLEGIYLR